METSKLDNAAKIKWIITVVVPILILLIPTNDVYTKQMSLFFATTVFGLFLMAFEFYDPLVVSIVMPMSWVFLGVTNAAGAMSGWTNTVMYMVVGAYFLANALDESGLLRRIALWIISKCKGSWFGLLFTIYIAGIVLSLLTFGMAYIIMATLCIGIIKSMDMKMPSKETALIGFACLLGVCTSRCFVYTPVNYSVILVQAQLVDPTLRITAFDVLFHNLPMFVTATIALLVAYKFWKVNATIQSADYFINELTAMGSLTTKEKKTTVFMVLFFALLLTSPWTGLDANLLFALSPWVLLLPGINVATQKSVRGLNWQNIFFIAACMAIGNVAASLGIGAIIAEIATPYMSSVGTTGFFIIVFAIIFVLNFFMTPLAIWSLMSAPLAEIALASDMSIRAICYCLSACSEAIILPYEYVPYLIVFSFGMMSMKDFIKLNVLRCVIIITGFIMLILPFWRIVGVL